MPDSIGRRLKQAREERNFSKEKVEQLTRIRAYYIQALEADDYSVMSSAAQARGFLRNYSDFLGMNIDEILDELQRAQTPVETEHISGPLPSVDNASPIQKEEEKPARSFLTSILDWFRRNGPAAEVEFTEAASLDTPIPETIPRVEPAMEEPEFPKKARGRKKKMDAEENKTERVAGKEQALSLVEEKKEEILIPAPVAEETTEVKYEDTPPVFEEEVRPGLLSRFLALFSIRVSNANQPDGAHEIDVEASEPVIGQIDEVIVEDAIQPVEEDNADVPQEAGLEARNPNLLVRVTTLIRDRLSNLYPKKEVEVIPEDVNLPVEDKPEKPQEIPEEIFAEIGAELRKRRDLLSLTIEEVERHTRLRAAFIKAMEEGLFDKLPSPVQTRGMLTNYAAFLDLDADVVLLRFADALQARRQMKYPDKPAGSKPQMQVVSSLPLLRSFIAGDLLFGVVVVAMLFVLAIWGVGRMIAIQTAEQALPTAPSIPEVLAGVPQATDVQAQTSIPATDTPVTFIQDGTAPAELPTLAANVNVQLNIVASERTFMRVVVDGEEKFNGRVLPGTVYPYEAESQIEVLTGNGAALRITYNGRDLGLMGGYGEVVDSVYTAVGVATPTATLPPTPTNTPFPTPTLPVTQIPAFTPTLTVTP